jgi:hypothetical protein
VVFLSGEVRQGERAQSAIACRGNSSLLRTGLKSLQDGQALPDSAAPNGGMGRISSVPRTELLTFEIPTFTSQMVASGRRSLHLARNLGESGLMACDFQATFKS